MKQNVNTIQNKICISQQSIFTNKQTQDVHKFEANDITIEQVDKVPIYAVSIRMVNCSLCSCKGLNFHQQLTHLDLSRNFLKKISGIENISSLENVDFSNNFITDISALAGKNKLKVLKVSNNMIFRLDVVSSLHALEELEYASNYVQSHKPVIMHSNFKPCWLSLQKIISLEQCMHIMGVSEEEAKFILNEDENNKIWEYIKLMIIQYKDQVSQTLNEEVQLCISDDQELTNLVFIPYLNVIKLLVNMCNNFNFTEGGFQKLNYLFVSNSKVKSLQGIQNFKQFETLFLRNNGLNRLSNELSLISELNNLRSLNIAQNGVEDLTWLKLNQLESLDVSENKIKDISVLNKFKDLKNLDISFNLVGSVEALRNLVQLEQLDISNNKIKNINCLNKLEKLVYFNITCNRIISVAVCLSMNLLMDLRIDQNVVCDIDMLTKHQNNNIQRATQQDDPTDAEIQDYFNCDEYQLQKNKKYLLNQKYQANYYHSMILQFKASVTNDSLELIYNNELRSISFSDKLNVMKTLKIFGCPNVNFDPHSILVQNLIIQNCQLNNIINLEQMTQLVSLDLSSNELRFVLELGELVNLKTLILKDNRIARIDSWIQNLKELEHINMQNNKLIRIKQLLDIPLLNTALLQGNTIRDIEFLKRHRNYTLDWLQPQNYPTISDYEYYLGDNRNDQMVHGLIKQIDLERYSLEKAEKYKDYIIEEELTIHGDQSLQDLGFLNTQNMFLQKNTNILTLLFCVELETANTPFGLNKLTINNCELSQIKGLEMVLNLTFLDLSSNKLTEVTALFNLIHIEELILNNNMIIKIDCLDKLVNLKNFEIKNNKVFDSSVLKFWKNITKLFVNDNFINDFTELFNHDNYNPLWISSQKIPEIADVKNYLQVEATDDQINAELAKNNKQQINKKNFDQKLIQKFKQQLTNNKLQIVDNQFVQDLNFVNHFKLSKLALKNCINVKFDYFCNVKILHVTNCRLSKIDGINKMLQLQELNLEKNNLEEVSVLSELLNLQTLILNDNKIYDLSCLQILVNLKTLNVCRNKLLEVDRASYYVRQETL
ncbi:leucine-rich_repeat domain-containing protein [Hexamita inflata]|uniref:Leucine-rich repeat domain-containing protein n=1 Tax=Hexamita inflata TaxID=28002 RepID=A0AA86TD93_9EUKA|nr:leucine-rich repeat domain-containing protein [Hexamita inflata]